MRSATDDAATSTPKSCVSAVAASSVGLSSAVDDRAGRVDGRRQHGRPNPPQSLACSPACLSLSEPPMHKTKLVTLVAALLAAPSVFAQSAWTAPATQKIRPGDAAGSGTSATLEA